MLNIVLTGATGYVGSAFLKKLANLPEGSVSVKALIRSPECGYFPPFVECVQGGLPNVPDRLFFESPHVLVHFGVKQIDHDASGFESVNVLGTQHLLDKTNANTLGVIYGSTLSVQGQGRQSNILESEPLQPKTLLAKSRAQAEQLVFQSMKKTNKWAFCLRPRFILGKDDQFVLPGFIKLAQKGIYIGDGQQKYSVITVDDYASLILKLANLINNEHQVTSEKNNAPKQMAVNAGYQDALSFEQIFSTITERFQIKKKRIRVHFSEWFPKFLKWIPSKKVESKATQLELIGFDHYGDISRLEKLIGNDITQQSSIHKLKTILE